MMPIPDLQPEASLSQGANQHRVIALEEHFTTSDYLKVTARHTPAVAQSKIITEKLLDLGDGRLAAMDEGGIDLQVLSLAAAGQEYLEAATATSVVRDANDELAAAIQAHPQRFAGFASLALKNPDAAANELERCVKKLGFKGGFVNGTEGGGFLDDAKFTSLFESAQELDVPLYLHPTPPLEAVQRSYFGGLPEKTAYFLSTAAWGWHVETGLHVLRLILSGLFDRFPRLQIIIGHNGEHLPYSLARIESALPVAITGLDKSLSDYFHEHFYATTSGYFTMPPFLCALQVVGTDRLMFSVDYPYRGNDMGRMFLQNLAVSPADFKKITHANAERLLKLQR
jgi:uncharacterized protein